LSRAPRQPSAYNLFMKTEVARIKQENTGLSHKEAFKEAARNWGTSAANPQKRGRIFGGEDDDEYGEEGEEIKDEGEDGQQEGEEGVADGAAPENGEADAPGEVLSEEPKEGVQASDSEAAIAATGGEGGGGEVGEVGEDDAADEGEDDLDDEGDEDEEGADGFAEDAAQA